jgi:S-adenosylmethionine hydrolase
MTNIKLKELLAGKRINLIHDFGAGSLYESQLKKALIKNTESPVEIFCGNIQPHNIEQTKYTIHAAANITLPDQIYLSGVSYLSEHKEELYLAKIRNDSYLLTQDKSHLEYIFLNQPDLVSKLLSCDISYQKSNTGHFDILDILSSGTLSFSDCETDKFLNANEKKENEGKMIFSDQYGNIITDLYLKDQNPRKVVLRKRYEVGFESHLRKLETMTPVAYKNSDGYLEIALSMANAAKEFNMRNGQDIKIIF